MLFYLLALEALEKQQLPDACTSANFQQVSGPEKHPQRPSTQADSEKVRIGAEEYCREKEATRVGLHRREMVG